MRGMLTLLLIATQLLTVKQRFDSSRVGDYIVTEQDKVYSLLTVRDMSQERLVLEEFTLPAHKAKKVKWKEWALQGAGGHTSHILYEIDLDKNQMERVYSLSRGAFLSHEAAAFIPTLISLPLSNVKERKKIGPAPNEGVDMRKIWNPPLVREGKKVVGAQFEVKRIHWPKDGTLLAEKTLDLYFDKRHPEFPFPNWIEITDGSSTFKIRCVDSGSGLELPEARFPLQPLEFLQIEDRGEEVIFKIAPSGSDKPLKLYAIELSSLPRNTIEVPFTQTDQVTLQAEKTALEKGKAYIWFLTQEGHPELATQSSKSFNY